MRLQRRFGRGALLQHRYNVCLCGSEDRAVAEKPREAGVPPRGLSMTVTLPPPHLRRTQQQQQNWLRQRQSELEREATLTELRREGGAHSLSSHAHCQRTKLLHKRRRTGLTSTLFSPSSPPRLRPAAALRGLRRRVLIVLLVRLPAAAPGPFLRPPRRSLLGLPGSVRQPAAPAAAAPRRRRRRLRRRSL